MKLYTHKGHEGRLFEIKGREFGGFGMFAYPTGMMLSELTGVDERYLVEHNMVDAAKLYDHGGEVYHLRRHGRWWSLVNVMTGDLLDGYTSDLREKVIDQPGVTEHVDGAVEPSVPMSDHLFLALPGMYGPGTLVAYHGKTPGRVVLVTENGKGVLVRLRERPDVASTEVLPPLSLIPIDLDDKTSQIHAAQYWTLDAGRWAALDSHIGALWEAFEDDGGGKPVLESNYEAFSRAVYTLGLMARGVKQDVDVARAALDRAMGVTS